MSNSCPNISSSYIFLFFLDCFVGFTLGLLLSVESDFIFVPNCVLGFLDLFVTVGLTICVAGRYSGQDQMIDSEKECRYFKDNLGDSIFFFPRHGHSTYELSDRSYISIGDNTTSLIESFGRGCKIMACNPSLLPQLDFPITGVWALSEYEYDSVKRKILKILSIKKSEWLKVTCSARESLLHNGESTLPINNIENILFGNR
jgi:hypothetical protein